MKPMKTKLLIMLLSSVLLASCSSINGIVGKTAYKENLENIRLGMTTSQIISTVGHEPNQIYTYPKYTAYEYKAYLRYLDNSKFSQAENLFTQGFKQQQNYQYLVNFFGVQPNNDTSFLVYYEYKGRFAGADWIRAYDSSKPVYRLFGNESQDYALHIGALKQHGELARLESKTINVCMIFEHNRLKAVFSAFAPSLNRTQSCAIPLNLRNEYFN